MAVALLMTRLWAFLKWVGKTIAEKLLGDVVTPWLILLMSSGTGAAIFGVVVSLLKRPITFQGWAVAAIIGVAVACVVAIGVLARLTFRAHRKLRDLEAKFQPVTVEDREMHLEWRLLDNPRNWVNLTIKEIPPELLRKILTGPYHLRDGCREELNFVLEPQKFEGDNYRPICPRCDFGEDVIESVAKEEDLYRIRRLTLRELQRMSRNGAKLSGVVVLEQPLYWARMVQR
jgi:hypothetical protein